MDYADEFCNVATDSGSNPPALIDAFFSGLSGTLKDHLTLIDLLADLEALIHLATEIGKRLIECQRLQVQQDQFRFCSRSPAARISYSSPAASHSPVCQDNQLS